MIPCYTRYQEKSIFTPALRLCFFKFGTMVPIRLTRFIARSVKVRPACVESSRPIASITFDDFPKSAWEIGGRLLAASQGARRGMSPGGFCGRSRNDALLYDRSDLFALASAGHEIACHGFGHQQTPTLSTRALEADRLLCGIPGAFPGRPETRKLRLSPWFVVGADQDVLRPALHQSARRASRHQSRAGRSGPASGGVAGDAQLLKRQDQCRDRGGAGRQGLDQLLHPRRLRDAKRI